MKHVRNATALGLATMLLAAVLQLVAATPSAATGTYSETTGVDSHTWTNYTNAGGTQGPTIPAFTTVQITCAVQGFRVADGNTWWYQIASSPWNNVYYVSADPFYNNGRTSGPLAGTPFVDPAVPTCASLAGGTSETTGGAANTWTNYTNAGGTQGPTIATFQTVQIACALSGFRVADGNTWWYQIASSPWNHAYYVSADAFYNNGRTSGSLAGTPFVDPAVPLCSGSTGPPGNGTAEQQGRNGVNTFANFQNASGLGPRIAPAATVQVSCKVYAPAIASVNPDGYWYLIASSPWNNQYYAPANTFMNGDPPGGPFAHNTDFAVPDCGNAPRSGSPSVSLVRGPAAPAGYRYAITLSSFPANTAVSINCYDSISSRGFYRLTLTTDSSGAAFTQGSCYSGDGPDHWVVANGVYGSNHVSWGSGGGGGTPRISSPAAGNQGSTPPRSQNSTTCHATRYPVNCATGNFWHTFKDFSVPGRGVPLDFTHTYTSSAAGKDSRLGFGWTDSYNLSTSTDAVGNITVNEENGATVAFTSTAGGFVAPSRVLASLTANADGTYTFTRQRTKARYTFSTYGQLISETDRNGYTTTLNYAGTQLTSITDPAGRSLTLSYAGSQISQISDPAGNVESFSYDPAGNLITVTNAAGGTWLFTYDLTHLLTTMTAPGSRTTTNVYDGLARTTSQTDPANRTTTWSYSGDNSSPAGGTTTMTDPKGIVTTYGYQNLELLSVTHAAGTPLAATTSYTYDPATLGIASETDPLGHVTAHTYDNNGNELSKTEPQSRFTSHTYNAFNQPLTATDPTGVTTTYTYDSNGNALTTSRPLTSTNQTQTTTLTYGDSAHPGDVTGRADPNGNQTTYAYDSQGDQTSITDPLGNQATATFDVLGRKRSSVSPKGNALGAVAADYTTTYTYDALGDLLTTSDPLGHITRRAYDADQNPTGVTDPSGNTSATSYNADGEAVQQTRADGTVTQTTYDGNGNVLTEVDGAGHTTSHVYDALNRTVSTTDPLSRTTGFTYDLAGNALTKVDPAGRTTTNTYDANNELTSIAYSDGTTPGVIYAYDADGRRTSMTDGTGTTGYSYDSLGRLTASTDGAGHTVSSAYDLADQRTSITYPNGKTVALTYDTSERMVSLTDWLGRKTTFAYDANSNMTTEVLGSTPAVTDRFTYDASDNVNSITDKSGATTRQAFSYTRNANARVSSVTPSGGTAENYSYDAVNQLTQDAQGPYTYDATGNLTRAITTAPLTYDDANELTARDGTGSATFGYNAEGDRTSTTPSFGTAAAYKYDQASRLIGFAKGTTTASYAYNGDGLRTAKTVGVTTSAFTWDTAAEMPLLLADRSTNYIYGPGGVPVESITSVGTPTFLHHDQLGSTTMLTSATGLKVASLTYASFGQLRSGSTSATPLLYAGQYRDAESGLYYLRARYYDPGTGQFLSVDPMITQTRAPYGYASDDPINQSDPSGQFALSVLGAAIGGVVGSVVGTASYALTCSSHCTGRGYAGAFVGGAVGGAVAGACDGATFAVTACGAAGGFSGQLVNNFLSGYSWTNNLVSSTAIGAAGGYFSGRFVATRGARPYKISNVWDPGINAMRIYIDGLLSAIIGAGVQNRVSANGIYC